MKKHGPAPIADQWCPVCETTRLPCPASKGRWVIIEMRMLFLGVRHKQVICHVCRQRWREQSLKLGLSKIVMSERVAQRPVEGTSVFGQKRSSIKETGAIFTLFHVH